MRPYTLRLARRGSQFDHRCFLHHYHNHTPPPQPFAPSPPPRKSHPTNTPTKPPAKFLRQPVSHLWTWHHRAHPRTWKSIRRDIVTIGQLSRYLNDQIGRAPEHAELAEAFRGIVEAHEGSIIVDDYAYGLLKVYEHVRGDLPVESMRKALGVVYRGSTENQVLLARAMFSALRNLSSSEEEGGRLVDGDIVMIVHMLSRTGNSAEALEVAEEFSGKFEGVENERVVWEKVLEGFSSQGDEEVLLRTWERLEKSKVEMDPKLYTPLVTLYCEKGELDKAKMWYRRIVESGTGPTASAYVEIIKACLDTSNYAWGSEIMDTLLGERERLHMGKEAWDVVFKWHLALGTDPGRIDELLDMMEQRAEEVEILPSPDITTINNILRSGIAVSGPDFPFEDYLSIADARGFNHDRATFELKLQHKINQANTAEALSVYEDLKTESIPREYHAGEVKHLLRHLCTQSTLDKDAIQAIYTDLMDWDVRLDVETLCPLLRTLLEDCCFKEVINLLTRENATNHEKSSIITLMISHISNSNTSIEAAWDTYQILYQVFPETSVRQRTDIMTLFFELGRSDMGVMIFQHMRQSRTRKPLKYTYRAALLGVAANRDLEALKLVHNALKLDYQFDPDTRLLNCLMTAYVACGLPSRALEIWDGSIRRSVQGPDRESVAIALDAASRIPHGGVAQAQILWGQLRSAGYKFSASDYAAYVEALGRNGLWDEGWKVAKEMKGLGVEPDVRLYYPLSIYS
ncbi:hypothetical protein L873DRAFT_1713491 [Choiromyces venosus 120613-1]|uniref:Pentacotripeptide-repeat region of PRORP domain-containing protein n=1 Tax=Choiromyces venosus 120613-1 TaxID=1336337 RepID=A0A3N4J2X6_9PEZI|nr:hypothetical protein L873DRAFT_1713491 [Choiromyces venosus 120613-1]